VDQGHLHPSGSWMEVIHDHFFLKTTLLQRCFGREMMPCDVFSLLGILNAIIYLQQVVSFLLCAPWKPNLWELSFMFTPPLLDISLSLVSKI